MTDRVRSTVQQQAAAVGTTSTSSIQPKHNGGGGHIRGSVCLSRDAQQEEQQQQHKIRLASDACYDIHSGVPRFFPNTTPRFRNLRPILQTTDFQEEKKSTALPDGKKKTPMGSRYKTRDRENEIKIFPTLEYGLKSSPVGQKPISDTYPNQS